MAIRYANPVAGSNANAGTLTSAPKATLYACFAASSSGDTILLAQGLYHPAGTSGATANDRSFVSAAGYIQSAGQAGITIGSYDAGYGSDLPVLDGMAWSQPGDAGWTHVGSGVWSFVPSGATTYARRLWVGSLKSGLYIGQRRLGMAARRCDDEVAGETPTFHGTEAAVIAALSADAPWYSTSNNGDFAATPWSLYLWTGSETIDPPTYYGGIAWVQAGVSADNLTVRNSANGVTLQDLIIRGCATSYGVGMQNMSSSSVSGLLLSNVGIEAYALTGLGIAGKGASGYTVTDVEIRDLTVDAQSSADEIETGSNEFWEGVDDVEIGYCTGIDIDGLTIRAHASAHSAMSVGASGTATAAYPVTGARVVNADIELWAGCQDARAFAVSYANGVKFKNSHIRGGITRSQIGGKNVTIESVLHDQMSTAASQFAGGDVLGQWVVSAQSDYAIESLVIKHCILDVRNVTAAGSAFGLVRNTGGVAGAAAGTVTFANNIAILNADQSMFGVGVDNNTGPTFDTAREQTFSTNAAVSSNPTRAAELTGYNTAQTAILGRYEYAPVAAGVSVAAASVGLTADYRPMLGSPLIGAGTHLGYTTDLDGHQRWNPPTIGAYEFMRDRDERT